MAFDSFEIVGSSSSSSVIDSSLPTNATSTVDVLNDESLKLGVEYSIELSQGQTTYYLPVCPSELKPYKGQIFNTLDEGIEFYKRYASACAFDVRHGSRHTDKKDDIVILKWLICSREGYKDSRIKRTRQRASKRVGCMARIVFRFAGKKGYVVKTFVERHTHKPVECRYRHFLKSNRNLHMGHKKFILDCSKANIGPTLCHRVFKEFVGGYSNVGASVIDFKNFRRDLLAFFAGSDAQVLLDKFHQKRELCDAFFFDFDVDSQDRLSSLFWADPILRKNFAYFGEVVSFDATYRTNKYQMVFAPFTGLDHHKKCVTFGAGLLLNENIESYVWLFERFKKAMGNDPKIIVTDQDMPMKSAIARVFPNTRHRLCMWHIMQKVPEKTKADADGPALKEKLHSIVWDYSLEPAEFEEKWLALVDAYPLENKKWFHDMFAIRQFWIPAYFRDIMFGGLVRTTSISEVQNKFFGHFTDRNFRLVELLVHYDSALDAQRHTQSQLNYESATMVPDFKTTLQLERHAADVFTLSIFKLIQTEICAACFDCRFLSLSPQNDAITYTIVQAGRPQVQTVYTQIDENVVCSCRDFQRVGLPCRHMFFVFKNLDMTHIPNRFILSRWTKLATIKPTFCIAGTLVDQCAGLEERQRLTNTLISYFFCCMGLLEQDTAQLKHFARLISDQKDSLMKNGHVMQCSGSSNAQIAEEFAGTSIPTTITVHPPEQAKTKGSGKRILGGKELGIQTSNKKKRKCGRCKKYTHQNRSTCKGIIGASQESNEIGEIDLNI